MATPVIFNPRIRMKAARWHNQKRPGGNDPTGQYISILAQQEDCGGNDSGENGRDTGLLQPCPGEEIRAAGREEDPFNRAGKPGRRTIGVIVLIVFLFAFSLALVFIPGWFFLLFRL